MGYVAMAVILKSSKYQSKRECRTRRHCFGRTGQEKLTNLSVLESFLGALIWQTAGLMSESGEDLRMPDLFEGLYYVTWPD